MIVNNLKSINFSGRTQCYSVTDIHQEAKKFAEFLEKISQNSKNTSNVLFLNNGDLFGGIYSRNHTKNLLVDFKRNNPHVEVVTTLGNNDFISEPGYDEKEIPNNPQTQNEFLKSTINDFNDAGIHVVCANILDKNGNVPNGIKSYQVINRDGDRILVTGYCIERNDKALQDNYSMLKPRETVETIKQAISKEKPDAVVLLNHDYLKAFNELKKYADDSGVKIDYTIGGHDHEHPYNSKEERISNPAAFAREMHSFVLNIPYKQQQKSAIIEDFASIYPDNRPLEDVSVRRMIEQEEKLTGLSNVIAPNRKYNLVTKYAHPNPLGTFVADSIMEKTETMAGFVAGSAIRMPVEKTDKPITKYDSRGALPRGTTKISVVSLTPLQLKEFLNNSVNGIITKGEENSNFIQCSSNIKLIVDKKGAGNEFEVSKIYIDGKNILDPKFEGETFKVAIDGFSARNLSSKNDESSIIEAFEEKLHRVSNNEKIPNEKYPVFEICDTRNNNVFHDEF